MMFSSKKSNILFSYLFFILVQNFKKKKHCHHMRILMFSITSPHFERITWILCVMSAITNFEESSFVFSFVSYGLVTKSFGTGCTFEQVAKKTKCQKMNVNFFTTNVRWIISPSFYGAKSLEATIHYNDFEHKIPSLQGKANKFLEA
jgi:hypothetical protein